MAQRVCPWWLGYVLASPLRRLTLNPVKVVQPYVREGVTVLEPGSGMGFFTIPLARLVGSSGRVVAVDVQEKMIEGLKRRVRTAGLIERVDARVVPPDSMQLDDLAGAVDFTLAYFMVHEMPDAARFFREVAAASKPGARLLLCEPSGHVEPGDFDKEVRFAAEAGLQVEDRPRIGRNRTALLRKPPTVSG